MKGTVQEIVGRESGLWFEDGSCWLTNWSSNLMDYHHKKRDSYPIKNVLLWMIKNGWISFDDDDRPMKKYLIEGNDVSINEFNRSGVMYRLTTDEGSEIWVLAIDGWI